ncbi:unnamed protein product [Caretta caretta]
MLGPLCVDILTSCSTERTAEFNSVYLRLTSSVGIWIYSILPAAAVAAKLCGCWEKGCRRGRGEGAAFPGKVAVLQEGTTSKLKEIHCSEIREDSPLKS